MVYTEKQLKDIKFFWLYNIWVILSKQGISYLIELPICNSA